MLKLKLYIKPLLSLGVALGLAVLLGKSVFFVNTPTLNTIFFAKTKAKLNYYLSKLKSAVPSKNKTTTTAKNSEKTIDPTTGETIPSDTSTAGSQPTVPSAEKVSEISLPGIEGVSYENESFIQYQLDRVLWEPVTVKNPDGTFKTVNIPKGVDNLLP